MIKKHLSLEGVGVTFAAKGREFVALRDINLTIEQGQFVAMIGHSGCGKSTLLNVIAGLVPATTGAILLDGKVVDRPGADRAMIFQDHSLLPWLSVYDNVRLAVDKVSAKKRSKLERHDWTLHNLELVHMAQAKDKRPHEISGGMKQRVGIARALAMEPRILLMDEPFGALDALTRATLQDTVMSIHAAIKNTVIMITHDVDEAVLLGDRIIMMTNGPAATIGQDLAVQLPRPRARLDMANNGTYAAARTEVLRFLYERFNHPEDAAA